MSIKRCARCEKKAHYLRIYDLSRDDYGRRTDQKPKFCSSCYHDVGIELCIEADEFLMKCAM